MRYEETVPLKKNHTSRALKRLASRDQLFACLLIVIFFTRYLSKQWDIYVKQVRSCYRMSLFLTLEILPFYQGGTLKREFKRK